MKKISCWMLVVMAAFIVISCDKDEPELISIYPGLYEINHDVKYGGQLTMLKQRVRYNTDGTYEATNFQNNTAVEEIKGKYKMENKQLVSYDIQHREISKEGTWLKIENVSMVDTRKIKKSSFQYYFKYPDDKMREQYKGVGLSEGWKTYKRISD